MIRLSFLLFIMALVTEQSFAISEKPKKPLYSRELINEKIDEFDKKLSEYLHIPIKKFSSILTDISGYVYELEIFPLQTEIKQVRQELADVRDDLKDVQKQIHTLTDQIESLIKADSDTTKRFQHTKN